jgi:hypothetical protein
MRALIEDREKLLVRQKKEWGEILLPFEAANRFELCTEDGETVGYAAEESSGFGQVFLRQIFGRCRAAKVHITDLEGQRIALVDKPFRWYFHRCDLFEGDQLLGSVQRRFSILHRLFAVLDPGGKELLQIKSPFFRIWTFQLFLRDMEVGRISKRWGGLLKEMFSDADTFGIEFLEADLDLDIKKLLVAAVFLVDFTCFENNQNNSSFAFGGD